METDLFRQAAMDAQSRRLHGEVILQQSFSTRALTGAILIVVIMAAIWVTTGQYARTEPARGILVPIDGSSKIYALHAGVVTALMVKDGDSVKAGQKLAVITMENPNAAGNLATRESLSSIASQEGFAAQQLNLAGKLSASEVARLGGVMDGLRIQETNLEEQIDLQREVVASTALTFDQLQSVVEKGFVSKLEFERRRQLALSARQDLSRLNQQLASTRADIARTAKERGRAMLDGQNNQMTARSTIETLRQQRTKVEGEASYLIEATVSGRITAIQTGIGRTVAGSVPLMVVMPEGARLRADIYVPSRAIGFVRPGQEVRLLYDAFPYQRFGSFTAHVQTISRVAVAGDETDAPFKIEEPVYRITAVLERQQISAYGKPAALQPGMTLVANMVLERQSFLDWLLSPLRAVANRN